MHQARGMALDYIKAVVAVPAGGADCIVKALVTDNYGYLLPSP